MSITYSDRVFVALGIHRGKRICRIVIYGFSGFRTSFHIIT